MVVGHMTKNKKHIFFPLKNNQHLCTQKAVVVNLTGIWHQMRN